MLINKEVAEENIDKETLIVVVDTHKTTYVEAPELLKKTNKIVIIDHHRRSADYIENATLTFQEVYASSAAELVTELLQYTKAKIDLKTIEAESLYAGIMMDTKNFTFKTGVRTFEAAAYLRKCGVNIIRVKKWFQSNLETFNKIAKIVQSAEIVDDTIIVNYYYEKKNFNLTIDKNINSIIVNGKEQFVNGKLGKVEVYRKELGTAKIQVVYTISVKNIGELAGKATIMENIPRGMKMLSKDNAGWKIENSEATYETGMIEPGKTQDIKVVFVWENAEANIGTIQNIAQVIGTESESGFAQSDEKDDADGADVIVAISTGDSSYVVTMGLILTVLSAGALVVAKKVKE